MSEDRIRQLLVRGVHIPQPSLVVVAEDVDPERIDPTATLFPFVRIEGPATVIGKGSRIGSAGPVLVRDCALGENVDLASGSFEGVVFLDGVSFGPSAHARPGTLFEEGASAAHTVGTKQTILLPYATLGSNINFCDALLAGGSSAKDHSEVGSGFIHFNFTPFGPNGDKATASLFGTAQEGVWLRSPRIFLGGAGGVVGPLSVGFGTVLGAGSVYRRDRGSGLLVFSERLPERETSFDPRILKRVGERVQRNLAYLAELAVLRCVYRDLRSRLFGSDPLRAALAAAALALLDESAVERVRQLERLASGLTTSATLLGGPEAELQRRLSIAIPSARTALMNLEGATQVLDGNAAWESLLDQIPRGGTDYRNWILGLAPEAVERGKAALAVVAQHYLRAPELAGPVSDLI